MSAAVRVCALFFAAGVIAVPVAAAPFASAQPAPADPQCVSSADGGQATECADPGNVQLDVGPQAAQQPDYIYPWDDEFYGPAAVIGGPDYHGGGGGGGGGHR